jgi:peptide/nickel transport system permease protein
MGIIGVAIIIFFSGLAILAPLIAPISPNQVYVSGYWAVPSWATALPGYNNLPPNTEAVNPNANMWTITPLHSGVTAQVINTNVGVSSKSRYDSKSASNTAISVNATIPSTGFPAFVPLLNITQKFSYKYQPPYNFLFGLSNMPITVSNISDYYFLIQLIRPDGVTYSMTKYSAMSSSATVDINYKNGFHNGIWSSTDLSSNNPAVLYSALGTLSVIANPGLIMMNSSGTYTYRIQLVAVSKGVAGHLSLEIGDPYFFIYGRQYGLLGTDDMGRDLWSEFTYGSQISIEVGIVASLITVGAGTLIGLIAGIYSGMLDETLMRLADIVLTIPFVPLAIVVIFILVQSASLAQSLYFWLVVLFAVLSWPALARIIRAQTLSLKERGFVESATAMGASRLYIVRRHLLPNVMGLVYATLALSVPGFILTEAALDFLLPGSSTIPTWGRMVSLAYDAASSASFYGFGWWWFIFPGIAIVLLSLAFVLLGYALDSTFNPRLRKR